MMEKKSIVHHVFFWLKDPESVADRNALISGIRKLADIETVKNLSVGIAAETEMRDVIDNSWNVAELMYFDDLNAQAVYQAHPLHLEFIDQCSHLWSKVLVYDMEEV